ncbi:MAG: L-threonylcarbamoyladenylate synthase [Betaproteobacteria bacterium]|nr:L-threonylcarbamoyladenylate synthase [Betaproteobacteria bacterium]
MSASIIKQAVEALQAGGLVALPTETVYGLGADATNPEAVAGIFAAKGRPADHPLIVHLPSATSLGQWAENVPQAAWDLAVAFWPGPLTLILKKQPWVPLAVTGGQDTVGLRVPAHPLTLELLAAFAAARAPGVAGIAAPSANRFGRLSPTTAAHVQEELGGKVSLILDGGPCVVGIESTIVDFSRDVLEILRPGAISPDDIASVASYPLSVASNGARETGTPAPRVSGSLAAHYAPLTLLRLVKSVALPREVARLVHTGRRVAVLAYGVFAPLETDLVFHWKTTASEPAAYARELYANLRTLDALGAEVILVEEVPNEPAWQAIADRLSRAATGSGVSECSTHGK